MDTREQLRAAARDLFLEGGLASFSMRKVAQRTGVSATAIYRHFADKDALLADVLRHGFETFGRYLMDALQGMTPLERFRRMGRRYFDFGLDHPRDYSLMFMTNCSDLGFERLSESTERQTGATFQFLVDRIAECMHERVFVEADPVATALTVWSHTHGLMSLRLVGQLSQLEPAQFRAQVECTLDTLERGLRVQ